MKAFLIRLISLPLYILGAIWAIIYMAGFLWVIETIIYWLFTGETLDGEDILDHACYPMGFLNELNQV